jgi:hypothetical protein
MRRTPTPSAPPRCCCWSASFTRSNAKLWSLIASCERHTIDPQRYLTSVLAKLPTTPVDELEQFLPDVWKADDAAEPVQTDD